MNTRSSAGSIPHGLTLYTFEYPEPDLSEVHPVPPPQQFLTSDEAAAVWAGRYQAIRAVNVLSGRVIRAKQP